MGQSEEISTLSWTSDSSLLAPRQGRQLGYSHSHRGFRDRLKTQLSVMKSVP